MKIKIIRLKVESENQDFDFSEFFEGSSTIYNTNAQLVKEKDGYYWYAFITYEPKTNQSFFKASLSPTKALPDGFEAEAEAYLQRNPPKKVRTNNSVKSSLEAIFEYENMEDFLRLRNLGRDSMEADKDFFEGLLEIVKKYKPNLKTDEDRT